MTHDEHKAIHARLHKSLDELLGYYLGNTDARPSTATVADLIKWSHEQTQVPEAACCHCVAEKKEAPHG